MKRVLILVALFVALSFVFCLSGGQDAATAIAEKEAAEERYKSMTARIDGLEETLGVVRKHLAKLGDEVRSLREEVTRLSSRNNDAATKESLERLAKSIKEVDDKRMTGEKNVLDALSTLQKEIGKLASPPERSRPALPSNPRNSSPAMPNPAPPADSNEKLYGYEYTVVRGDSLLGILAKVRAKGAKLTRKQLEEANPGVNWDRLQVGQKIRVYTSQPVQQ